MSALTLTVWQKKGNAGHPTLAGREHLENPTEALFDVVVDGLLATVGEGSTPFQIVAQMGHSSRGYPLGLGWSDVRVKAELWMGYQGLIGVNG